MPVFSVRAPKNDAVLCPRMAKAGFKILGYQRGRYFLQTNEIMSSMRADALLAIAGLPFETRYSRTLESKSPIR